MEDSFLDLFILLEGYNSKNGRVFRRSTEKIDLQVLYSPSWIWGENNSFIETRLRKGNPRTGLASQVSTKELFVKGEGD